MSTAAHTQGPWRAGSGTGGRGSVVSDHLAVGALSGSDAIDYYGGNMIAESVAQENIPLIAAAPDLLAALQSMLSDAECFAKHLQNSRCVDEARAAIAKATSGEPG